MRLTSCALVAFLLSAAGLLNCSATSHAGQFYADGNQINLATGRSNTFSTGGSIGGNGITSPIHPSYGFIDFRSSNSVNGPYWQVNFPTAYEVSSVYVETYDNPYGINTMNMQTTIDGTNWITQAAPAVVNDGNGNRLSATFPVVSGVVGVRLVSTSFDDAAYPGIFRAVRILGPNTGLTVNDAATPAALGKSEFSITQATWNGGSVQSAPGWAPYSGGPSVIAPIDDFTTTPWAYNSSIYKFGAGDPTPIDILLNDNYLIDTVSIAAGTETGAGGRTAASVDIWYSSDAFGAFIQVIDDFVLTGNSEGFYTIPLGGLFDARRIRYDFAASNNPGETFIAELNAYAVFTPVPEPSTFALLGLGAIGLAIRTRRRRTAA